MGVMWVMVKTLAFQTRPNLHHQAWILKHENNNIIIINDQHTTNVHVYRQITRKFCNEPLGTKATQKNMNYSILGSNLLFLPKSKYIMEMDM